MGAGRKPGQIDVRLWDKERVKNLIVMWPTEPVGKICEATGYTPPQVSYIVNTLRSKYKFPLKQKNMTSQVKVIVDELASELGVTLGQ